MKRFRLTAALALGLALLAGQANASVYAPLLPGEQATYEGGTNGTEVVGVSIDRSQGDWKHYTDFAGLGPLWIWTSASSNRIYFWSTSLGTYQLFADPDAGVNSSSRIDVGSCNNGDVRIDSVGNTVTTAAGTFQDCIVLELNQSCRAAGTTEITLAPGVGLVKWSEWANAGPRNFELTRGTINGQTYPQIPKSVTFCGTLPHPDVFINLMPSPSPRPTPTVRAGLEITNNQGHDLTYQFNGSSLKIEISIYDASGAQVSTSVRGRAITRDIALLNLKEGETWRFDDVVELVDDNGQVLAPGVYTIRVELRCEPAAGTSVPAGGRRPGAVGSLNIQHVF